MLPLDRRTGMTEVELGYSEQEAMAEAQRCLKCYINTILEGSEQDGTDCVLCGGCVDVCPENCLELVPLDRIEFDSHGASMPLRTIRMLFSFELEGIQPEELGSIHRHGDVEGRNALYSLRSVRAALPGQHHHHGGLPFSAVRADGPHHDSKFRRTKSGSRCSGFEMSSNARKYV